MFRKTLLLTLLITLFLAGCGPASTPTEMPVPVSTEVPLATEAPASAAIELTDGLGRSVVLDGPAQRIVSLAPSNTEILFAIGASDQIRGAISGSCGQTIFSAGTAGDNTANNCLYSRYW